MTGQQPPTSLRSAAEQAAIDAGRTARDVRALYWRFRQPDRLRYKSVHLVLGSWATPRLRDAIYRGYYEKEEWDVLRGTLRPDDRVLEVGSGIGFVTTWACRIVGDERVFAYEANPELIDVIRSTAARNGFAPEIENVVLGHAEGTRTFYVHDDFWSSSLKPVDGGRPVEVPQRSLAAELDRIRPSYLMVDIEGGEVELLGGVQLPESIRAVCLETHGAVVGDGAIQALLSQLLSDGFILDLYWTGHNTAFLRRTDRR